MGPFYVLAGFIQNSPSADTYSGSYGTDSAEMNSQKGSVRNSGGTGNTDKMESSNHQLPPIFPPYIIFLVSVTIVLPKRVVSRLKTMKQFGPSFVILNTGRMSS